MRAAVRDAAGAPGCQQAERFLTKELAAAGEQLRDAGILGGGHWVAAADLFKAIPGLFPPGGVPRAHYDYAQAAVFREAYAAQLAAHRKEYGSLLR